MDIFSQPFVNIPYVPENGLPENGLYMYSFKLHNPCFKPNYDSCYIWRHVSNKHILWSQLPNELVELIATFCVDWKEIEMQPCGISNVSNLREFCFHYDTNRDNVTYTKR